MIDRSKKIAGAILCDREWPASPCANGCSSCSKDDRRIIGRDIQKVEFGWPIGMPYCRPLGRRPVGSAQRPDRRPHRAGDLLHRATVR